MAGLIRGLRPPLSFGKCRRGSAPLAASMLPIPFPGFSFSVEEEFQEKYQKPHSQGDVISALLLLQFPKPLDEVGVGGGRSWGEWGWEVGREGVGWGLGVSCPVPPTTYP